jgi:hypothetical protein
MLLEISGPFFVQGNAIGVAVLSAIDLDHEPLLMAREICKIRTYGRLAPEMRILDRNLSEMPPQLFFGDRHLAA